MRTTFASTLATGINETLARLLEEDPRVVLLGQDIGRLGGVFRVTQGLQERFGEERVRDAMLAEASIVGQAVGMALSGLIPICEIQFDGFTFPATNQLVSQAARVTQRWGAEHPFSLIVRIPSGGGTRGVEHHAESNEGIFASVPGLRVACPTTTDDYSTVLREAIDRPGPVLVYEPIRLYWSRPRHVLAPADPADPTGAVVRRPGRDVSVVTYGPIVQEVMDVAEKMAPQTEVEVVDLRWVSSIDHSTVLESVRRTGRLVVVHESSGPHGVGAEVCAVVAERAWGALRAPVGRVAAPHRPHPPADHEAGHVVDVARIERTIREVLR